MKANIKTKISVAKQRIPGIDKGKIWMANDLDTLAKRELAVWYGVGDLLQARKVSRKKR